MILLGLIFLLGGAASVGYGLYLNSNIEAVWNSFASTGNTSPGLIWIVAGAVVAILGIVMMSRRRG